MTQSSSNLDSYLNLYVVSKRSSHNVYLSPFGKLNMISRNNSEQIKSGILDTIEAEHTDLESDGTCDTGKNTVVFFSANSSDKRG